MSHHYYIAQAPENTATGIIQAATDGTNWAITGTTIFIVGIAGISLIKYFFDKIGN